MEQPLVSIICTVFNHGPYLRACLDGFVMQKTSFPFEIVIHDDASTDDSAQIIREYEAEYPELFRPVYQTKNQYSQNVNIWGHIQFPMAKGKYIAICEGDDCWTDPYKLQKQFDFMEKNPDCSLCFHNAMIHWYDSDKPDEIYADIIDRFYSGEELLNNWICPTASYFLRTCFISAYVDYMDNYPGIPFGDIPLVVYYSLQGSIYGCSETMSVYGKHRGGWTSYPSPKHIYRDAFGWEVMRHAFGKDYRAVMTSNMTIRYLYSLRYALKDKDYRTAMKSFYRGILRQPIQGLVNFKEIVSSKKSIHQDKR